MVREKGRTEFRWGEGGRGKRNGMLTGSSGWTDLPEWLAGSLARSQSLMQSSRLIAPRARQFSIPTTLLPFPWSAHENDVATAAPATATPATAITVIPSSEANERWKGNKLCRLRLYETQLY